MTSKSASLIANRLCKLQPLSLSPDNWVPSESNLLRDDLRDLARVVSYLISHLDGSKVGLTRDIKQHERDLQDIDIAVKNRVKK